jgi:hypothetical protein
MGTRQQPTDQAVLMVAVPILPGREKALRDVLAEIKTHLPTPEIPEPSGGPIPFRQLTTVHFARWVVFETMLDADGTPIPAQLAMGTAYDGPLDRHLRELVTVGRAGIDAMYGHCVGYPPEAERTDARIIAYLLAHQSRPAAAYVGARWRTRDQIRRESELRLALEAQLDELVEAPGPLDPDEVYSSLRGFVRESEQFAWAMEPPCFPGLAWTIGHWAGFVLRIAAVVVLLPVIVPVALVVVAMIRIQELREGTGRHAPSGDGTIYANTFVDLNHLATLTNLEDQDGEVQNQMTLVSVLKPGRLRLLVLRFVLAYARFRVEYIEKQGLLGGVPSIHFAHWNIIDQGRRLVFFSNYDGTWESYLGDFIDHVARALTGIWSNTLGFPPARFLLFDGAQNEQQFKAWTRTQQIPTDVWYTAYPALSLLNVNNSTAIRAGLSVEPHGKQRDAWLRRL